LSTSSSASLSTLKQAMPSVQRHAHFGACLADTRKDDALRVSAGGQHALEFTARDDVEAAAGLASRLQDAQRRSWPSSRSRSADCGPEGPLVGREGREDRGLRIDEQRRAVGMGQIRERDLFDMQRPPR
jgi:hypothetical protein